MQEQGHIEARSEAGDREADAAGLKKRWVNARRASIAAGVVLAVFLSVVLLFAWSLSRAAPSWWLQIRSTSPMVVERAERMEHTTASVISRVRPSASDRGPAEPYRSDPWIVEFDDHEVSAWLAARLPRWIEEQGDLPEWPSEFSEVQVRFEPRMVRLGVRYSEGEGGAVVSADLKPEVRDDGSVWVRTTGVRVGRLPLPPQIVINHARDRAERLVPEEFVEGGPAAAFFERLLGRDAVAAEPVLRLPDRRRVRLLGIRLSHGKAELLLRTESPEAAMTSSETP